MGVYNICIGKGVIIPARFFFKIFKKEIAESNDHVDEKLFNEIVQKHIGPTYQVCVLEHDAFEGRHSLIWEMFEEGENEESALMIDELVNDAKLMPETDTFHDGRLMFIGQFDSIAGPDFSYYVKAPEIIYGLAALLPSLMKLYPKYLATTCDELTQWCEQKPCIWTFVGDCCCCG